MDASAALALHFEDEFRPFELLEERLAGGEEAYTAPNKLKREGIDYLPN